MSRQSPLRLIACFALTFSQSASIADDAVTRRDTSIIETRETELSQFEIERAKVWSLNQEEWRRYQRLMQGIRGSVSASNLSPVEVLGIHARDAAERREYAERWATAMHDDAERILAFQRAYDEAMQRLYPNQRLIDADRLLGGDGGLFTDLRPTDRLILRVRLNCPSCDVVVDKAIQRLDDVSGIDVQFAGATESQRDRIREWARAQGIQPQWVQARRVTLNITEGDEPTNRNSPGLYIRRGEAIERLAFAAL